ncbi:MULTISPECIES: phenazine biosynthesis FMN-dependent oxidase PhzG [Streptomyces]|uniref:Phenazine biosynthesis protein n=2 Tax=Streptomyces venezuelae TaxID=54571 RepID=A0A5P2BIR4_STRVZ|nr:MULTISPECIES: phenazine biosynthesis FMN-dependent oxidase PhzG [Streptomyces]NEA01393.1 pyridoxal 5'-phosphate synthase [Streptomyces sp. SID10116]MYY80954.1 pyridoxal 5'-phosphate synthase [Streptomyces sp. SID335]MYY82547.1 pyridoxal 5'-phosphate synthase [Streptomyces sp. SID335]MYY82647.1 pyridoxal 5'-phosphate synthase [Streptomyces sp. SID335]MYZ13652.1 pyridoxal 5'-phosphate synthase [Streptomyces sp. SID337]
MSDVRRSETLTGSLEVAFPEFRTPPAEPLGLLSAWLKTATEQGVREPRALALATADARGRTSSRILAVNQVTDRGIVFITHAGSQKGRELAANPWASGVLYWRETSQQITVAGPVRQLPRAAAEELWAARAVFTHPMSSVSLQSEPLRDLDHLEEIRARALQLGEPPRALPCPDTFVAFVLEPDAVEFWANGTDRLHERLRYDRTDSGWDTTRLQP